MKKLIYITFFLFCTSASFGQNKLTNAVYHLKNDSLDKAKELIDAASIDTFFSEKSSTWYYRGFIYKELFKRDESTEKQSPLRIKSVNYYKKSLEYETDGPFSKSCRNGLKYLSQTIYNHVATSFDPQNYPIALSNYEFYKEVVLVVDSTSDFSQKDISMNLAMATTYGKMAELDSAKEEIYLKEARKSYDAVLLIDSNNVSANYNIGIIYYNQGVEIVNHMDYSLDLFELNEVQDRIIELFRQSLPFMKKAYDLNPKRKETLIGLQGIYFSLNDIPKSEAYKKELEELDKPKGEDVEDNQLQEPPEK